MMHLHPAVAVCTKYLRGTRRLIAEHWPHCSTGESCLKAMSPIVKNNTLLETRGVAYSRHLGLRALKKLVKRLSKEKTVRLTPR